MEIQQRSVKKQNISQVQSRDPRWIQTNANHENMERTVYVKGVNNDFIARLKRNPKPVLNELNTDYNLNTRLNDWKLTGESLRITNLTPDQKKRILGIKRICNKFVEITESWALTRYNKPDSHQIETERENVQSSGKLVLYIASGVPLEADDEEIKENSMAEKAKQ